MTIPQVTEQDLVCAYRAPGTCEWRSLVVDATLPAEQNRDGKSNTEALHNVLLASLQMQHLVVLAGSGCSLAAGGPSMGELWNRAVGEEPAEAVKAVATKVRHDLEDKDIERFLSRIEAFQYVNADAAAGAFLSASRSVILDSCSSFLRPARLKAHRIFLHRLSRRRVRDQRLRLFTTNYDLCFERAAGDLGEVVLDGFSFAPPRRYDPRFFSYDIIRRSRGDDEVGHFLEGVFLLYKLHGSVNWARSDDGTIVEKADPTPEEACLIYPARGKYQQSYIQPHLESISQYLAALREPNTCVLVVGFGFNDDHLAEPLLAAAQSNPHLRLIIVDPCSRKKAEGGIGYWGQFSDLAARGDDIWFIATSFEDFAERIPDLKSLTPADTLMRAIQGAVR